MSDSEGKAQKVESEKERQEFVKLMAQKIELEKERDELVAQNTELVKERQELWEFLASHMTTVAQQSLTASKGLDLIERTIDEAVGRRKN